MIGKMPMCEACEHFARDGDGYSCAAFPEGIPEEIAVGGFDHREIFPGQENRITFEQDPDEPDFEFDKGAPK